jgi:hypothetical protein
MSASVKSLVALAILACIGRPVLAQQDPPAEPARRPAPLADVADLEPAVDVSRALRAANAPAAQAAPPAAAAPPAPAARAPGRVIDTLDLGTTSITGNAELPKVLYIVPWKRSDLGDLVGRPVNTLLDEVLAPVDPEVFERQLSYYETLHGDHQEE